MIRVGTILCMLFAGCNASEPTPPQRTVDVYQVQASIHLVPPLDSWVSADPNWLALPHCGDLGVIDDALVAYGGLDEDITAVVLVDYGDWGPLFSRGGSRTLELQLRERDAIGVTAALDVDRPLYIVRADDAANDTGIPGGETEWFYDPTGLTPETKVREDHIHLPMRTLPVAPRDRLPCVR